MSVDRYFLSEHRARRDVPTIKDLLRCDTTAEEAKREARKLVKEVLEEVREERKNSDQKDR